MEHLKHIKASHYARRAGLRQYLLTVTNEAHAKKETLEGDSLLVATAATKEKNQGVGCQSTLNRIT